MGFPTKNYPQINFRHRSANLMILQSPSNSHESWDTRKCVNHVETYRRYVPHQVLLMNLALFPSQLPGRLAGSKQHSLTVVHLTSLQSPRPGGTLLNQATLHLQPALHCVSAWQHQGVIIHDSTSEKPQTNACYSSVQSQALVAQLFLPLPPIQVCTRGTSHSWS